jgi:predicted amidohydrolase YtcJ
VQDATPDVAAADTVLSNGYVYTVDADRSVAEAVALQDGLITFVGTSEDAKAFVGSNTDVVDLQGQMLLPGFHDSHTHILVGDLTDEECSLFHLETMSEIEARLRECTQLDGFGDDEWIIGAGWGPWLFENSEPDKALLDELFPDRPVYLDSSFSHTGWVNSRALELAGIDEYTDPGHDGVIVRDPATGEATGALHESAKTIITNGLPTWTLEYEKKRILAAVKMAHRLGVTASIEPGVDEHMIVPILELADEGAINMRNLVSISPISLLPGAFDDGVFEFLEQRDAWRRPNLNVDSVKIYLDGVIESGTGAMLEPYEDAAFESGLFFYSQENLDAYFTRFDAMGLQIHVHATGDAATRHALNAFEAMRDTNGVSGNRHHITHVQLISAEDLPRFAAMDIGATFQTLWAYPDAAALELDLPLIGEERTYQMYPLGGIDRAGGRIVGGSDYWVSSMDPLLAIEVGITRQDPYSNDGPILNANERVSLETMLEAYTINGAYTMKLDEKQGSIEVGKRADLVLINKNLFELDPYEISDAYVTMTIFDGQTIYQRNE